MVPKYLAWIVLWGMELALREGTLVSRFDNGEDRSGDEDSGDGRGGVFCLDSGYADRRGRDVGVNMVMVPASSVWKKHRLVLVEVCLLKSSASVQVDANSISYGDPH